MINEIMHAEGVSLGPVLVVKTGDRLIDDKIV